MSLSITFCDPNPVSPFLHRLDSDLANVRKLQVAVAYLTSEGVRYLIQKCDPAVLGSSSCTLCVSVHHPTDLEGLVQLHTRMKGSVFVYTQERDGEPGGLPQEWWTPS
jgi:hypothetical protein